MVQLTINLKPKRNSEHESTWFIRCFLGSSGHCRGIVDIAGLAGVDRAGPSRTSSLTGAEELGIFPAFVPKIRGRSRSNDDAVIVIEAEC